MVLWESRGESHVSKPGKCHYLIISKDIANESIELGKNTSHAEDEQKVFGITIDKDFLSKSIIKTANQKLSALTRVVYNWFH